MIERVRIVLLLILVLSGCQVQADEKAAATPVNNSLRLIFDQGGYYQLQTSELNRNGFSLKADGTSTLAYRDQHLDYLQTDVKAGQADRIIFYVPPPDERYLSQQVLLLENQSAERVAGQSQPTILMEYEPDQDISRVESRQHFEENNEYLSQAGPEDPFMWSLLESESAFKFSPGDLPDSIGDARIIVNLWSPSSAPATPDHGIEILLNGNSPGIFTWEGAGHTQVEVEVPTIETTSLQIEMKTLNPKDVLAQRVYLQDIELFLTRPLIFGDEPFSFQASGFLQTNKVTAEGFLVTIQPDEVSRHYTQVLAGQELAWESCSGCLYEWVPVQRLRTGLLIEPFVQANTLKGEENQIDWLVLAPENLQPSLQPLVDHRAAEGLRTMVIDPQQIYDSFYGGLPHPRALQLFFQAMMVTWQEFPGYVLLVGDFSTVPGDYAAALQQIPAPFVKSTYLGETVSDMPYIESDPDHPMPYVIGRVPLSNPEQVSTWVKKLISSEKSWQEKDDLRIVAVADGQEAYFSEDAGTFLALFGSPFTTEAYTVQKDLPDDGKTMKQIVEGMPFLISYFGHGSVNSWGKDQILNPEIISELPSQSALPLIINMTCLSGYYIHPEELSLAEYLLQFPGGGAVSMIAPTSLTTSYNQSSLYQNLALQLQRSENIRIGDVLLQTWAAMDRSNPAVFEVMESFILLGDPANRIR